MCVASILFFLPPSSVSHSSLLTFSCVLGAVLHHPIISSPYHFSAALPFFIFTPFRHHCNTSVTPLTALTSFLPFTFTCHCITVWLCVLGCLLSSPLLSSSSPSSLGEGAYALGARRGNSPTRRGNRGEILLTAGPQGTCVSASGTCRAKKQSIEVKPKVNLVQSDYHRLVVLNAS